MRWRWCWWRSRKSAAALSAVSLILLCFGTCYLLTSDTFELLQQALTAQDDNRQQLAGVAEVAQFVARTPRRSNEFYYFNVVRSDEIGVLHARPDLRAHSCLARSYQLPSCKLSVVVAFYDEARSALLRTIMSIYRQTPARYLHEIILVDDASADVALLPALQRLNFPPFTQPRVSAPTASKVVIKIQRNEQRQGLIESRNRGARSATGDYLVFLDSHCEVGAGWAEPLLEQLLTGAGVVAASPVLDSIDADTLAWRRTDSNLVGGFDWSLHFHWLPRPVDDTTPRQGAPPLAFRSPTFAGGVFMISRNWFFKLNAFNSLLKIWGGESIEFSIKLWLCGGQIVIVPCSRVAHIFREQHPFRFPDGNQETFLSNTKVIAESWLDAYKHIFYAIKPAARAVVVNVSHADLDSLRSRLSCRPFAWYLQHVLPQLKVPNVEFVAYGTLYCGELCVQAAPGNSAGLILGDCYSADVTRWYLIRGTSQVQSHLGKCLGVAPIGDDSIARQLPATSHLVVKLQSCQPGVAAQRWLRRGAQLINEHTHLCLDNLINDAVAVSHCRHLAPAQAFHFSREAVLGAR